MLIVSVQGSLSVCVFVWNRRHLLGLNPDMKQAAGAAIPTTLLRSTNSTASASSTMTGSGWRERYLHVFMWSEPVPEGMKVSSVTASVSQIAEYHKTRRDPPSDLVHQHKEATHRLQWQKAQLERASPALLNGNTEYTRVGKPPQKVVFVCFCCL